MAVPKPQPAPKALVEAKSESVQEKKAFVAKWPTEIDTTKYEAATTDNAEDKALEEISSKTMTDEELSQKASDDANKEMKAQMKSQASNELDKMKKGDYDKLM